MPDINNLQLPREFLIVGAAARNGIFETLNDSPMTAGQLARSTQLDPRAVWTVMEALVSLGYLTRNGAEYSLSSEARSMFYEPESENFTGFSFMHGYYLMEKWIQLPEVIRTGKPVPRKRSPEQSNAFIKAMSHHARKSAPAIAARCLEGLPGTPAVLDIGGGPLTYASAFAALGARVTVLDLPEVVDMMQPEIKPGESITMTPGDFNEGLPEGPYQLAYLGNIAHIFGESANKQLIKRVRAALDKGGRIAINDFIRGTGAMADIFAVNMLVNTEEGGTWTWKHYKTWLAEAGFNNLYWEEIAGRQVIFGDI